MFEVKLVKFINKLHAKVHALSLSSLNRRSIRNIKHNAKVTERIANIRDFCATAEVKAEQDFVAQERKITEAYREIQRTESI